MKKISELILVDQDYFKNLIADIDTAKKTIDMETYIFSADEVGNAVANALVNAAKRGVKIRLLVDGVGTRNWKNAMSNKIEAAGIKTKVFHPLFWLRSHWKLQRPFFKKLIHLLTSINSRNHRKTCVIDSVIAYIGSANISDGFYLHKKKTSWHDITVRLTGMCLHEIQYAFNKAWKSNPFKTKIRHLFTRIEIDPVFRLNFSGRQRRIIYKALLQRVKQSKNRIWIANAYFFPNPFFLFKLAQAAKRGVDVRIVLPGDTDVIGIELLTRSCFAILFEANITVMKYSDGILHSKILIIDDWFCVGSSNLNNRSFKRDLEVDLKIQTPEAKTFLENQFQNYCENSQIINKKSLQTLTWLEKIILWFARLIRL